MRYREISARLYISLRQFGHYRLIFCILYNLLGIRKRERFEI